MKLNIKNMQIAMANACLSVSELALKSEVSRVAITRFIKGKSNPKPVTIGKIAKALNVKVEDIIEE